MVSRSDHAAVAALFVRTRATILRASSGKGRCNALASSHGARSQTSAFFLRRQDHRHRLRKQPVGQISVQPRSEKYFASPFGRNSFIDSNRPTPQRGVSRSSRTRGGMRWTRQRFARDGIAGRVGERPVSDQQRADERCCSVRRSRVVLTPRRWRQVRGCYVGPTGLRHNVSPWTTVAKEPGHRGEHEGNR